MFKKIKAYFKKLMEETSSNPGLISFQTLRRAIGWLAVSLPFILILGSFIFGHCCEIQPSISHYYYTNMREILVGTLCAVSIFLFSYKGYSRLDNISANIAGFFSLCVALFPTNKVCDNPCQYGVVPFIDIAIHYKIHFFSATLFLLTLAFMSIFLFRKTNQPGRKTPEKKKRNQIYLWCGILIIFSLVCIAIYFIGWDNSDDTQVVFWFETLALLSFGISWLIKGEVVLGDKNAHSS